MNPLQIINTTKRHKIRYIFPFGCLPKLINKQSQLLKVHYYSLQLIRHQLPTSIMMRLRQSKEDLFRQGIDHFRDEDFFKALGYFTLAQEQTPNDIELVEWKVKCFRELREYEICLKYIKEMENPTARMMIIESQVYLDLLDFSKIAKWLESVKNNQEEVELKERVELMRMINKLYSVFVELKEKYQYAGAAESLSSLMDKLPPNQNLVNLKIEQIKCLLKCGNLQQAKSILECFQRHTEGNVQILCLKIQLYFYLRDQPKSKQLLDRGRKLYPQNKRFKNLSQIITDTEFTLRQGRLYAQYLKYKQAIQTFTNGLLIDPYNSSFNAIFYYHMAITYKRSEDNTEAQIKFIKALQTNPKDIYIRKQKAIFNMECKEYVAAILQYEKLMDLDPKNASQYQKEINRLKKIDKKNGKQDCYKILKLETGASQDQIKKAYKALAMKYHPDRNRTKSASEIAENSYLFMQVTEAYKILIDPESRKKYDLASSLNETHSEQQEYKQQSQSGESNSGSQSSESSLLNDDQDQSEKDKKPCDSSRGPRDQRHFKQRLRSRSPKRQQQESRNPSRYSGMKYQRNYQQRRENYKNGNYSRFYNDNRRDYEKDYKRGYSYQRRDYHNKGYTQ